MAPQRNRGSTLSKLASWEGCESEVSRTVFKNRKYLISHNRYVLSKSFSEALVSEKPLVDSLHRLNVLYSPFSLRTPLQTVLERTEVKTLSGANLKALLCVALCPGISTLRIAHRSGLHVVTTRRAVRELCARGLVVSDVEGRWKCTP